MPKIALRGVAAILAVLERPGWQKSRCCARARRAVCCRGSLRFPETSGHKLLIEYATTGNVEAILRF